MKLLRFAGQFVVAWLILMAAHVLTGILVPVHAPAAPHIVLWLGLSEALVVLVLLPAALRAEWRGWRLFLALWAIPASLSVANAIEGVVFLSRLSIDWRGLILSTFITWALTLAAWIPLFGNRSAAKMRPGGPIHSDHLGRDVLLGAAVYLLLYLVAGTIVFPFVRDYYATQYLPPLWAISALQLFVRGPLFVGLCVLLVRMYRLPLTASIAAVGVGWAVLSGVAPLMLPNPYMPDHVRWAHFVEVTSSNLCFAAFVAWLWSRPKHIAVASSATA